MKSKRVTCAGGCGRMVLRELGECRKCRRVRVHAGLKRIKHLQHDGSLLARVKLFFETSKQKFQRAKSLRWNRPKQISRVHVRERYPRRRSPEWPQQP